MLLALVTALALSPAPHSSPAPAAGACMAYVDKNLAIGKGNFYVYTRFSDARVAIKPGDLFEYDVYLDPDNPEAKGGVDIDFDGVQPLRDNHTPDQNGIDCHGDGVLTPAVGHWYHRIIPLTADVGHETNRFSLDFEGDSPGVYVQFVDNVQIVHQDGTATSVFPSQSPPISDTFSANGYSDSPSLALLQRSQIKDGQPVSGLVSSIEKRAGRLSRLASIVDGMKLAQQIADKVGTPQQQKSVTAAQKALADINQAIDLPDDQFESALKQALVTAAPAADVLRMVQAHLVGHAHIDIQWLWEWQEALQAAHDTWNQSTKFMAEYPGFSFTQSTAGYYRAVQTTWPDIFAKVVKYAKAGQWEVVGGRECEADENLLSPEDSVRQFLYAQDYFRKTFGKAAVVGWEPDTFGHTAQMPQLLQLAGLKYFYFCRGGKNVPLFYWTAPDGSKVLAYDQVAAGAWYNTPLSDDNYNEFPAYLEKTKVPEMMWVYGVGNHGGGPTREHLNQAETWMKSPLAPKVEFSTAHSFFEGVAKKYGSTLPSLQTELEGVFRGCYTTNAIEKKMNDQAEYATSSAEATAAVASFVGGFPYPTEQFAKNWEKICFNQHHDTLCGSSFHWAYEQTRKDLRAATSSSVDIARDAMVNLSVQVTPQAGPGQSFLVFNPLGWARDGWVDIRLPSHLLGGDHDPVFTNPVAEAPDGSTYPVYETDPVTHAARFYAKGLPAFGYRVFRIHDGPGSAPAVAKAPVGPDFVMDNGKIKVVFDSASGRISSLTDDATGHEFAGAGGLGGLENHLEQAYPEAWDINKIVQVIPLKAESADSGVVPNGQSVSFTYSIPASADGMKPTTIKQTFILENGSDRVDVRLDADWQVVSDNVHPSPFLRASFDSPDADPVWTSQTPFTAVTRPTDGEEGPVQAWSDVSGRSDGVTVVVDCKHGFSCKGSDMRMSLIRSAYEPDMLPNRGEQSVNYEIIPHQDSWRTADATRRAAELLCPTEVANVPPDAKGKSPLEFSFCSFGNPGLVATALKKAEDGNGYILRFFESNGLAEKATILFATAPVSTGMVNLLEDPLSIVLPNGKELNFSAPPWTIKSVRVRF